MIKIEVGDVHVNVRGILDKVNGEKLGLFAAKEWHRLYQDYVPFETGTLYNTVDIRPWEIEHTAPYARYLYYGEVYGPNFPITEGARTVGFFSQKGRKKHPIGKAIRFKKARASREWDKAAAPVKLPELAKEIQEFIDMGRLGL